MNVNDGVHTEKKCWDITAEERELFLSILNKSINEAGVLEKQIAVDMGFTASYVNYYLNGRRDIPYDHLCAICISAALESHTQRRLFAILHWRLPDDDGGSNKREEKVRYFMDHCYDDHSLTVKRCNKELCNIDQPPLTIKRGKKNG